MPRHLPQGGVLTICNQNNRLSYDLLSPVGDEVTNSKFMGVICDGFFRGIANIQR